MPGLIIWMVDYLLVYQFMNVFIPIAKCLHLPLFSVITFRMNTKIKTIVLISQKRVIFPFLFCPFAEISTVDAIFPCTVLYYIKVINKVYIKKKDLKDSSLAKQTNSDHSDSKVGQNRATSDTQTPHVKNIFMYDIHTYKPSHFIINIYYLMFLF